MKSKDLIARIQDLDPSGEMHCCIENGDIGYIGVEPAYWDGPLQVMDRDENDVPLRARRVRSGEKLVLSPGWISDYATDPDFVVDYGSEEERARYEPMDREGRFHDKEVGIRVDRDAFAEWIFLKAQGIRRVPIAWVDKIKTAALKFFDDNYLGPDNPLFRIRVGRSYRDCQEEAWEEAIAFSWDEYSRISITFLPKDRKP